MQHKSFNRVALITGATKGIGEATSDLFMSKGIKCILVARKQNKKQIIKYKKLYGDSNFEFIKCDVSKTKEIDLLVKNSIKKYKKISILFNNAAYSDFDLFYKNDLKMYEKIFDTNVKGAFYLLQMISKHMIKNKLKGKIINVSSQAGRRGEAYVPHYCASKAAIISYTQSAALFLAKYNINVNAIAPGVIDTPLWDVLDKKWAKIEKLKIGQKKKLVSKIIPLQRIGSPKEVADLVYFLSSEKSSYITGQTINIDGGNILS